MDSVKLAICGNQVSIWNLPEISKVHEFKKGLGHVTSASWNHDGTCLATCDSSNSNHINLTYVKKNVYSTVEIVGPNCGTKSQIRALQYPRSSQKCLCLAVDDRVMFYDVTKKKVRQDFPKIPNVTCLAMTQNDKYIAAGNNSGQLYLLNPLTGRPAFTHPIRIAGTYLFRKY